MYRDSAGYWKWIQVGRHARSHFRNSRNERSCGREEALDRQSGMIGKVYFERGVPVTILARWGKGGGPRNVLIRRHDGTKVVRPLRGLRRAARQS